MKIISWIVQAALWIAGILALVLVGWMLKAYQIRRDK
jgi:hypothetical protein